MSYRNASGVTIHVGRSYRLADGFVGLVTAMTITITIHESGLPSYRHKKTCLVTLLGVEKREALLALKEDRLPYVGERTVLADEICALNVKSRHNEGTAFDINL
jgi:hypothetical protein